MTGASLTGALALGLASSLHCVGTCGGINAALMLAASPDPRPGDRIASLGLLQLGRGLSYCAAGFVVAGSVSGLATLLPLADALPVLRVAAGVSLFAAGLSVAGWLPSPSRLDGSLMRNLHGGVSARLARAPLPLALSAGLGWGLMPCGMVYGALLTAALGGSAAAGAATMAAFALGTAPALVASGIGAHWLSTAPAKLRGRMRFAFGLICALAGIATVVPHMPALFVLCQGTAH